MALLAELILVLLWLRTLAWAALAVRFHLGARRAAAFASTAPGIAVVIPAFNEEDQIVATICAVERSNLRPAELIVVDDGSTDRTAEVARADLCRTSLIRSTGNCGKASALNAGFAAVDSLFVASLDADTRVDPNALRAAAGRLICTRADAVAFDLQVEPGGSFLSRLQAQEYMASLNFERAGQAAADAISILPGAATLFRRASLKHAPFRSRTLTEDADLTLELMVSGSNCALEPNAVARTAAPDDLGTLIRQRVRWAAGHMQCIRHHARSSCRGPARGRLVYINFVLGTLSPFLATLAMTSLVAFGSGPIVGLDWLQAVQITTLVVYLQRLLAVLVHQSCAGPVLFLLEPIVSGAVSSVSSFFALLSLSTRLLSSTAIRWPSAEKPPVP